jgi:2-polyprenyl-3-methyl-5-hydroxy-6-metoxy-1,4-benzoquinol methylase
MEKNNKETFWNDRFSHRNIMWGIEPSETAIHFEALLREHNYRDILIMGAGYGRNGKYFTGKGYCVDGIEFSETAIHTGRTFAPEIHFIKGDILNTELPKKYDAVFCYDIMQLFLRAERKIIVENCIKHCKNNGMIMISCLSRNDVLFGKGAEIEENTFEIAEGLTVHFSDEAEMNNMNKRLKKIKLEYTAEKEHTGIEKERHRIYGIYIITENA